MLSLTHVGEREVHMLHQLCFQPILLLKLRVELFLGRKNPGLSSGNGSEGHLCPSVNSLLDQHSVNGMMEEVGSAHRKQKKDVPSASITKLLSTSAICV